MPDQIDDPIHIILKRLKTAIGQNDKDLPDAIGEDQVIRSFNVITSRKGRAITRSGSLLIADRVGSNAVDGLGHLYPQGGTPQQLSLMDGEWWKRQSGDTSWTSIKSGLAIGARSPHLVANGAIYVSDGTNNVQQYDGAVVTDMGNLNTSFPKFKFGIYQAGRAIVGSDTDDIIYYSNVLNATIWDRAANALKPNYKDNGTGRAIVDLALLNSAFIYFKDNSSFYIDNKDPSPSNWTITTLDPIHGCVATRTAVAIGSGELLGGVLFLCAETAEGGKTFYRVRSIRRTLYGTHVPGAVMSYDIEDTLNSMNPAYASGCAAYFHNNKYILAFPSASATFNDTIAVLDFTISSAQDGIFKWSIFTGWKVAIFDRFVETNVDSLFFGDSSANSRVFQSFKGTSDNGVAIDAIVTGRAEDGGYPELNKTFEFVEVFFNATDSNVATIRAIFDNEGPIFLGTVDLTGTGTNLPQFLPFFLSASSRIRAKFPLDIQICRNVSIEVENNNLNSQMDYLGYVLAGWAENLSFRE